MLFAVDLKCLGLLGGIVGNLAAGSVEQGPQSSTGCYSQKNVPEHMWTGQYRTGMSRAA